jgi:lysophospholipase L1-like esterase
LGDSIAAGIGLAPATANTDPACGVTDKAYPAVVAKRLGMAYQNLACSGATAGDLVTEQHLPNTSRDIEPQLDRAFAGGTPQLITITAGANDIYWTNFLRKCYATSCGTTFDDAAVRTLLATLRIKLNYDLASIQARSNGQPPRVVLTGYYQPFSPACIRQQTNVTQAEYTWLRTQMRMLNQTIQETVGNYTFARYAPLDFSEHRLCTTNPWVQNINDPAPFHPTAQGQRAIANAVLAQAR